MLKPSQGNNHNSLDKTKIKKKQKKTGVVGFSHQNM